MIPYGTCMEYMMQLFGGKKQNRFGKEYIENDHVLGKIVKIFILC